VDAPVCHFSERLVTLMTHLRSLQLLARWTVFATPLISVIKLVDDAVGRLKGSVLCVASGGTLAVLILDGLEL
jgi:WD repeat-containing protein 7